MACSTDYETTLSYIRKMNGILGMKDKYKILIKWTMKGSMTPPQEADSGVAQVILKLEKQAEGLTIPQLKDKLGREIVEKTYTTGTKRQWVMRVVAKSILDVLGCRELKEEDFQRWILTHPKSTLVYLPPILELQPIAEEKHIGLQISNYKQRN